MRTFETSVSLVKLVVSPQGSVEKVNSHNPRSSGYKDFSSKTRKGCSCI